MLRSFITTVCMAALAAGCALIVVNVFDNWYHDTEERRAIKREQRNKNRHNRYE